MSSWPKPRLLFALLLSAILCSASCATHGSQSAGAALSIPSNGLSIQQQEHIQLLAKKLHPENTGSCVRVKEGEKTTLVYVGDTNYQLIACLNAGLGERGAVLRITSPGGDSDIAALAAVYIRLFDMSIEVDGICFSSCANYVAPAAEQLTILPLSFLGLHGAPDEYTEEAARKLEADVRAMPGIPQDKIEQYVQGNLAMLKRTSEGHKMIQRTLNIGTQWFRLGKIDYPTDVYAAPDLLVVPNKTMVQACLKGVSNLKMWEAHSDYEKAALRMMFPRSGTDYYPDIPSAFNCD